MSMTDPVADFLTRIRNAIKAVKRSVDIPASNMKIKIAEIMKEQKFIYDYTVVESEGGKRYLSIKLKYKNGESVIGGLKKISTPGLRRYVSADELPRVRNGLGIAIISTSKGLMTDKRARQEHIGGEIICEIW
ncbi:MAG: 30S ribosomal protein S8 [Ignavibacteria bacterium]